MAGLLDYALGNWTDDPNQNAAIRQGLLSAAFGAMAGRGNRMQAIGQGGLSGLMGYANTLNAQDQRAAQAQARQQRDLELQDLRDRLARQQAMQALPQQFYRSPTQTALAGGGGPTVENAQRLDAAGPSFDYEGYAKALAQYDPMGSLGLQSSLRKTEAPVKLGAGESLIDPKTYRPLVTNPKADEQPSSVREYNFAVGQGYKGSFDQWKKENARAGASNISLNTGQKGFENELKVRSDFRGEPIYKAHQEMQSAYSQIQQSLKQKTPAGDLAGATKIMKLLDPGSVVRESELGMAMAATGLLDRATNYASMVINGNKLTPLQRQEFQALADALYGESAKHYNMKRNEYSGIAKDYGLNEQRIVGPEAKTRAGVIDWGSLK